MNTVVGFINRDQERYLFQNIRASGMISLGVCQCTLRHLVKMGNRSMIC